MIIIFIIILSPYGRSYPPIRDKCLPSVCIQYVGKKNMEKGIHERKTQRSQNRVGCSFVTRKMIRGRRIVLIYVLDIEWASVLCVWKE